jgi:hypothetical protein
MRCDSRSNDSCFVDSNQTRKAILIQDWFSGRLWRRRFIWIPHLIISFLAHTNNIEESHHKLSFYKVVFYPTSENSQIKVFLFFWNIYITSRFDIWLQFSLCWYVRFVIAHFLYILYCLVYCFAKLSISIKIKLRNVMRLLPHKTSLSLTALRRWPF